MNSKKKYVMSEESRRKMRETALKRYAMETPEEKTERCKRFKGINKGRKHTPEEIEKIKAARAKQHQVFDEKARENMSKAQRRYWDSLSPEERKRKVDIFINAPRHKMKNTSIELKVKEQLDRIGIDYEQQKYCYNRRLKRGFYIDFYLPEYDIMIECNGTYWHTQEHRIARDELLKDGVENAKTKKHKNLKLITLWDYEINSNNNVVKERLNEVLGKDWDI